MSNPPGSQTKASASQNPMSKLSYKTESVLDKFRKRVLGQTGMEISEDEKDSLGSDNPAKSSERVEQIVTDN